MQIHQSSGPKEQAGLVAPLLSLKELGCCRNNPEDIVNVAVAQVCSSNFWHCGRCRIQISAARQA